MAVSMASLRHKSPLSPTLSTFSWVNQIFVEQGIGSLISSDSETKAVADDEQRLQAEEENIAGVCKSSTEMKRKGVHYGNLQLQDKKVKLENMHYLHDRNSAEGSDFFSKKILHPFPVQNVEVDKGFAYKLKKRPPRLVVPQYSPSLEFCEKNRKMETEEYEVHGKDFALAGKKGMREAMEDGYGVMVDILGDAKQAFFAVIDGHGGRAAADFVAENLGKNIVNALRNVGEEDDDQLEQAIREGYLVTDRNFLSQGVSSGACAASVLLKNGEVYVASVGDCRVVLSRKGVADTLTVDHRVNREDERLRIENSGGLLQCRNGTWRVHGSLAVSRAIGDQHLKEWIISDPDISRIKLTSDCEFLILASDGLWDKVNEEEAVDVVSQNRNSSGESCKKLVEIAFCRGNKDDITVMVINLQNFVTDTRQ